MLSFYSLILYIHILSVIGSIGPFFVLIPLLSKMKTADEQTLYTYIDLFAFVARLSKHAGHVLVTSGIILIWLGSRTWSSSWIVATLIILLGALYFIARAFSPSLRKLREPGHTRTLLVNKLSRALFLYIALMFIMMWFMVAKPNLW